MFGGQLAAEEIRLRIWDFILRNRDTYQKYLRGKFRNSYSKYEKKIDFGNKFKNYGILRFYEIEY